MESVKVKSLHLESQLKKQIDQFQMKLIKTEAQNNSLKMSLADGTAYASVPDVENVPLLKETILALKNNVEERQEQICELKMMVEDQQKIAEEMKYKTKN